MAPPSDPQSMAAKVRARSFVRVMGYPPFSKEFLDRLSLVDRRDRPPGVVQELNIRIDAQNAVERRVKVLGRERTVDRRFALRARGADDNSALHAAPPHYQRHGVAPMVAARRALAAAVVHARSAAEFAEDHHAHFFQESRGRETLEEGGHFVVQLAQALL